MAKQNTKQNPQGAGSTSRGVYKSAYKNAMRVTRTETNMAYRNADYEQWLNNPNVLGIHIEPFKGEKKSKKKGGKPIKHKPDICDKLAGDYPKTFLFEGWHPQCYCTVTPILISKEESDRRLEAALKGEPFTPSEHPIEDYPDNFKRYIADNADLIQKARQDGTEPYFTAHNREAIDRIMQPEDKATPTPTAETAEQQRQAVTTPAKNELAARTAEILKRLLSEMKNAAHKAPPKTEEYERKGNVAISPMHGKEETSINEPIAEKISKQIGQTVYLLPRIDPSLKNSETLRKEFLPNGINDGKNPDLYFMGRCWEAKKITFEKTVTARDRIKSAIENHIRKAKKQADNFVFEMSEDVNSQWIDEIITNYLKRSSKKRDIIIIQGNKTTLYTNKPGDTQ